MGSVVSAITRPIGEIVGGVTGGILGGAGAYDQGATNNFQGQMPDIVRQNLLNDIGEGQSQYRSNIGNQQDLAKALQAQMSGQGPSLAQMQLQDATNRNVQQGAGLIGSQRGINPALAARLVANQTANANQNAAGQAAQLRAQEQLSAQQQLGNLYGNIGSQALQYQGINQNAVAAQNQAINQASLGAQGLSAGAAGQNAQIAAGAETGNARQRSGVLGNVMGVAGGLLGFSSGGTIPGRADYDGDDESNDTVPALLSPGEIVIPRSQAKDPEKAKAFIDQLKSKPSYAQVVKAHKKLEKATADFEQAKKMAMGGEVDSGYDLGNWLSGQSNSAPQQDYQLPAVPTPLVDPNYKPVEAQVAQPVEKTPVVPDQMAGVPKELQGIYGEQVKAAKGSLGAAQTQAKGAERAYDEYANNIAKTVNESHKQQQEVMADYEKNLNSYKVGTLDPNRLWNSKSTGQKVSAVIGLILGGIGAGAGGGPNMALQHLNKQIDQDIESQKLDLDKNKNLLSLNMQKYKNLQDAEIKTKMDYATALQAQMAKVATQSGSQQAMANFHAANGQIQSEIYNLGSQLAQRRALSTLASGGASQGFNTENLPEEARQRTVKLPDGKIALAPSKEDATEVKKSLNSLQVLEHSLNKALDIADQGTTLGAHLPVVGDVGTTAYKAGVAARSDILTELNKLQNLNRLTEMEMDEFKKMMPDPGQWNTTDAKNRIGNLLEKIKAVRDSEYKNHLQGYDPSEIKMGAPVIK